MEHVRLVAANPCVQAPAADRRLRAGVIAILCVAAMAIGLALAGPGWAALRWVLAGPLATGIALLVGSTAVRSRAAPGCTAADPMLADR